MWTRGHVTPIWGDMHKHIHYTKQPLMQEKINRWRAQGYNHKSFNGAMHDSRNSMPEWCKDISEEIGLKNCGYVFYKMVTNDIMPVHVDYYNRYCEIFNVKQTDVYRAIVFLEDWKSGHYFEIDGTAICNYTAGDYILWHNDVPHAASNIGIDDRYTLQITGVLNESADRNIS